MFRQRLPSQSRGARGEELTGAKVDIESILSLNLDD